MTVKVISGVRDTVDSKYGISFCRKTTDSPVIIKEVRKDGIFATHGLVPGMVVKEVKKPGKRKMRKDLKGEHFRWS